MIISQLPKIKYSALDQEQKRNYNFLKLSAVLAEYGFDCLKPNFNSGNTDILAYYLDGYSCLRIILKNKLSFHKKYLHRELSICFPYRGAWYLYPHDELLGELFQMKGARIENSISWTEKASYSFPILSREIKNLLTKYKL